ncbi:predicted protein [Uncinocarpus reesii 1704]|uniref:Rho-GAP domain-containing protein n=1 Tax=Uncinocarpus reesii (strain UAMH 1704) TaxID=336963 RepID=C4JRD8_UNCRE|nr:uncharacterized protein UREG_05027 [Uncinocarpus reesii 1704]EEP80185.1 predicted protein [Uncinocarpus reesii 1704]
MMLTQARQYLSQLRRRAYGNPALIPLKSESESATATVPVTIDLAEKTKLGPQSPELLDLDVADQLLVQRSRQSSGASETSALEKETSKYSGSTIVSDGPSSYAKQSTPLNNQREWLDPDRADSQTPKLHGLVPAKKLRLSPKAEAILHEANNESIPTPRNTSNQTTFSEKSDITVCHDPSKRCQSPIVALDTVLSETATDPFSDAHAITECSKISSQSRTLQNTTNHDDATEKRSFEQFTTPVDSNDVQLPATVINSRQASNSSYGASRRILEGTNIARREFARSRAFLAFNTSAPYFSLEALAPPRGDPEVFVIPTTNHTGSLLHRIRTAKSSLTMGKKYSIRGKLRRMKTLATLVTQYQVGSLTGKRLEDLSRLGGESILSKLPPRYFPGTLRLPTCIAAPISALVNYGTATPFIHREMGNHEQVNALYSYFAGQVLGAEKLKEKISKTMRPTDLPLEQINAHGRGSNDYMHVISTVLKHFFAEIPGGILGSMRLYHALERISANDFSPINSRHDPGQKDYLPDIPTSLAARVRMIVLAIIALTTDAQLELICAIFGLLAVTADESYVLREFHYHHLHPKSECDRCEGLTDSIQLGEDFGHLLYGIREAGLTTASKMSLETRAADVTTMLIDLWKDISRQLWTWEIIDARMG